MTSLGIKFALSENLVEASNENNQFRHRPFTQD